MNIGRKLFRTVYFYLMTAGLPVLLIHLALETEARSAIFYAIAIALSFPLSLLPGRIKDKVPLRFPMTIIAAVLIAVGMTGYAASEGLFFLRGTFSGVIMGLLMLFGMREATLEHPQWTGQHGASIGLILYMIAGAATAALLEAPLLKNLFWIEAIVFLAVAAFYLNTENMLTGLATRKNARPPKSLVTGNRVMTIIFAVIAALVIFWSQLQDAVGRFGLWFTRMIVILIYQIGKLLSGEDSGGGGAEQAQNPAEMFSDFEQTEPSTFWLIMEKVLVVVAIIVGIVLIVLALRVIIRLLIRAYRYLQAYMARFAEVTGEDYEDEQEDLFDLDDLREQTKERLQKAVRRLTQKTKKWDDMDTREKVRFSVRQLYARSGYTSAEMRPLTIREAVSKLPKTGLSEDELSALYEKARYSEIEPTEQEANTLRKAVKS